MHLLVLKICIFLMLFSASCTKGAAPGTTAAKTYKKSVNSIDIFYSTNKNDREFLMLSLKAVDRFAKGFRKVVIVTDSDDDLQLSDLNIHNIKVELFKEQVPEHWGWNERYNHKQYIKADFARWTDAGAVLSLDSDSIIYDLLTPDMYFSKQHKPVWLYDTYENILHTHVGNIQAKLNQWRIATAHFLKRNLDDVEYEFMRFPGFLITRKLADKFKQYVNNEFHQSLFEFMTSPSISAHGLHSEFNYLGAFGYYLDPEKEYEFVNLRVAAQKYARINKQIPKELQELFPATLEEHPYPLIKGSQQLLAHSGQLLAEYPLWDFLHQPKHKYLLVAVRGKTGLANRIKSIVSGLATARLSGRKLCLVWDVNADMVADFHELFENDIKMLYNFRIEESSLLLNFKYEASSSLDPDVINNHSDIVLIDSYRSFSDKSLRFQDYLPIYLDELKSLKPVPEISERVDRFVKEHFKNKHVVGVHFRSWSNAVGDADWDLKSNPIEAFFAEMDKELARHPNTVFFIATDDQANKEKFIERYKDKVILSGIPKIARNDIVSQKDGLFEWLLLGKTEFVIGTNGSTYSDEATLLTPERRKIDVGPSPFHGHDPFICFDKISGKPIRCEMH